MLKLIFTLQMRGSLHKFNCWPTNSCWCTWWCVFWRWVSCCHGHSWKVQPEHIHNFIKAKHFCMQDRSCQGVHEMFPRGIRWVQWCSSAKHRTWAKQSSSSYCHDHDVKRRSSPTAPVPTAPRLVHNNRKLLKICMQRYDSREREEPTKNQGSYKTLAIGSLK